MAKISKITPLGSSTTYDIAAWSLKQQGRLTDANITHETDGSMVHFKSSSSMTANKPMGDGNILHFHWDGNASNSWDAQLYIPDSHANALQWRGHTNATTWGTGWHTVLDDQNYSTTCDTRYVKKSGDTMTGPLINNFSSSSIVRHFSDVVGSYLGTSATGIIKIKLPNTTSNCVMMTLRIMLYEYNTDSGKEIIVSGYTYNDKNWYNYRASAIGGVMSKAIRLAHDGTNYCVLIGATNTTWPYTTVQLADIYSSYGAQPETGYTISLITSESGLQNIKTVANQIWGAVWNDYAEYRKDNPNEIQEPGRCIKELGDGSLALTVQRLERGCEIVSDTFGFAIGKDTENGYNTPIASNGRVLAYPYESIKEFAAHIGWPVCSGPDGTVSIMTEEEEKKYPSRIIGTISEIPSYDTWGTGNVKVNGRVWIRIK